MSDTYLGTIQTEILNRLSADSYFTDITVLDERKDNIENEINRALGALTSKGGKVGACAVVMSPIISVPFTNVSRPIMDIEIAVRVLENVVVNSATGGTGKKAVDIASRVLKALYGYQSTNMINMLKPKSPTIIPVEDPIAPLAYEVQFTTRESDPDATDKCSAVVVTFSSVPGTLTLETATASASIYYTLDGSYPWSGNTTAAYLYNPSSKPTITQSCTVRAVAYKTNYIASNLTAKVLS